MMALSYMELWPFKVIKLDVSNPSHMTRFANYMLFEDPLRKTVCPDLYNINFFGWWNCKIGNTESSRA